MDKAIYTVCVCDSYTSGPLHITLCTRLQVSETENTHVSAVMSISLRESLVIVKTGLEKQLATLK